SPFGASEVPASEHYDDQLDLMLEGRLKLTHYERRDVESHAAMALGKSMYLRPPNGDAVLLVQATAPVKVRLDTTAKMTDALPLGAVSFSPHMEPIIEAGNADLEIAMEMRVPEELCAESDLARLGINAYSLALGWVPVAGQRLDRANRTFSARVGGPRIFAVLGPRECRRIDPGDFLSSGLTKTPTVPSPRGYTPLLERHGYSGEVSGLSLPVEERPGAAEQKAEAPTERLEVTRNFNTRLNPKPIQEAALPFTPLVRPEDSVAAAIEGLPTPTLERPELSGAEPSGVVEPNNEPSPPVAPHIGAALGTEPESNTPAEAPPTVVLDELPPRPQAPSTETKPSFPAEGLPMPTEAKNSAERKQAIWIAESPSALRKSRATGSKELFLAPKDSIQSPLRIGNNLELAPPVPGAEFHIRTNRTVRAQVMAAEEPPAPLPEGLAQFTYVFSVMIDQWDVEGSTFVSIQVNPALVEAENVETLRLYAFEESVGWQPIEDVRVDLQTATFRKLDMALRDYAVLGPMEHFLGKP
ncbi:MAG: hypothetical protein QGG73_02725, partial [Candidatus Hydrogenedentes bacterium]|nr:hypothetical protein [Candidatus Hydrogenedentota bacterium]